MDVLVESPVLERRNVVQTTVDDVKDENLGPLNPKQATENILCGQMLVLQPRHSRQYIRGE